MPIQEFINEKIYFSGSEPKICKTFGCGKALTLLEQLFSDHCVKCASPLEVKEFDLKEMLQTTKIKDAIEGLEAGIIAMGFESTGNDKKVIQAMRIKIDRLLGRLNRLNK